MTENVSNKIPWAEVVSSVSLSDTVRARAAQRFYDNKRFATAKNQNKRKLIRRLVDVVFDRNLSIIDMAQRIADEVKQNSDAKALDACVRKIEQLGQEGWHRTDGECTHLVFQCADLNVQVQPDALLQGQMAGSHLLFYAYFRQSPPLNTDAVRALLCLIRLAARGIKGLHDCRIVILDCYNDRTYEGSDFQEGEPWIARQMERVFSTYNAMYRIHLDGSPPPQVGSTRKLPRRSRTIRAGGSGFSIVPAQNQLCLQLN
jgi:hypothetical protein